VNRTQQTLLVIDDEPLFCRAVAEDLVDLGLEVIQVGTKSAALDVARERRVDIVLLDQRLPDGLGTELCPALVEANELCKIIFVTAFPQFENVVAALRGGAFDYLVKPCELEAVRLAVERSLKVLGLERCRSVHERDRERSAEESVPYFGARLETTCRLVKLASRVDSPVLLTGETGTGKSMVARAIHFESGRRDGEFVAVNCAALPEALIESELFGYERGAFTGATSPREGLFEMADGGSILLDEITELPVHLQARLLHVLEDHTVRRVGGRSFRKVNFRLIAATNVEPAQAIASRCLREDLYHRINVLPIHLPSVRERLEDVPALIQRLLVRLGAPTARLAGGEEERLARYDWPGNVRELRNVLERAILLSEGEALRPSELLEVHPRREPLPSRSVSQSEPLDTFSLAEVERRHIDRTLELCSGNVARAARNLGISRSTLRRKLTTAVP